MSRNISEASCRLAKTCALDNSIDKLRFAGDKRKSALKRIGINNIRDLFLWAPHRYLDFTKLLPIAAADVGSEATLIVSVESLELKMPKPKMQLVEVYVSDQSGVMRLTFFRQPWIMQQLKQGDLIAVSGKVTFSFGFRQMTNPFMEVIAAANDGPVDAAKYARVLPVHSSTEGVSAAWMRRIISGAIEDFSDICDFLPASLVSAHSFMSEGRAIRALHFPRSMEEKDLARRRLAYDELLCLQLVLTLRHSIDGKMPLGFAHKTDGSYVQALLDALPFALTSEQEKVKDEILFDMSLDKPMNRLLLGDVGTGKTAVAAVALAACADSNTQAAVMAPTSVLATQYAEKLGPILDAAGISWCLITGATKAKVRKGYTEALAEGEITVAFGTSAVLSDDVAFDFLSLVVVDEQHRFGVNQRTNLARKAVNNGSVVMDERGIEYIQSDILTMTATPIPRTMALSIYGDLTTSRILERPNKGVEITTKVLTPENVDIAYSAIRAAVDRGNQAYIVCPLVDAADEGEEMDESEEEKEPERKLSSVMETFEALSTSGMPQYRIAYLHGRMKPQEKDEIMTEFRERKIDILVSTTVIEVGVDVPNATVMLILDSDRFGIAQLHQLRGRVGRGKDAGEVYLEAVARKGSPARERLDALEKTNDGAALAELDLKLRHEGDIMGYRQSGMPTLRFVDMAEDTDIIEAAHADSIQILSDDFNLKQASHLPLAHELRVRHQLYYKERGGA